MSIPDQQTVVPLTVAIRLPRGRIARGETMEIMLTLTIRPGFRVESAKPASARAQATSIQLGVAEGLTPGEMTFPEFSVDPLGGDRVNAYVGTVVIRVPVTARPDCPVGPAPIAARVLFQATGEGGTLPPDQIETSSELEVYGA